MNKLWDQCEEVARKKQFRKWLISLAGILFILQLYFVREMLAAEVLFGVGFAILLVLCGVFYVVGAVGERSLYLAEAGIRAAARSARWGVAEAEEISKKQFRHRHSESAP